MIIFTGDTVLPFMAMTKDNLSFPGYKIFEVLANIFVHYPFGKQAKSSTDWYLWQTTNNPVSSIVFDNKPVNKLQGETIQCDVYDSTKDMTYRFDKTLAYMNVALTFPYDRGQDYVADVTLPNRGNNASFAFYSDTALYFYVVVTDSGVGDVIILNQNKTPDNNVTIVKNDPEQRFLNALLDGPASPRSLLLPFSSYEEIQFDEGLHFIASSFNVNGYKWIVASQDLHVINEFAPIEINKQYRTTALDTHTPIAFSEFTVFNNKHYVFDPSDIRLASDWLTQRITPSNGDNHQFVAVGLKNVDPQIHLSLQPDKIMTIRDPKDGIAYSDMYIYKRSDFDQLNLNFNSANDVKKSSNSGQLIMGSWSSHSPYWQITQVPMDRLVQ